LNSKKDMANAAAQGSGRAGLSRTGSADSGSEASGRAGAEKAGLEKTSLEKTGGSNRAGSRTILGGVPEGYDAAVLARLVESQSAAGKDDDAPPATILHIARDDRRLDALETAFKFFAPKLTVISFPAWDSVPFDRVSPNTELVAKRITGLARLAAGKRKGPRIVLTTINAMLQRLPPRAFIRKAIRQIAPGQRIDMNRLTQRLSYSGFERVSTVMEPGEFAVRGGILDFFPPGRTNPVRLDFFGDTLESIKGFDPATQRTSKAIAKIIMMPVSELAFGAEAVKSFRRRYVEMFGAASSEDLLYASVSQGQRYPGLEHWLPLFHDRLETLFDYVPDAQVSFDAQSHDAIQHRFEQIDDHYQARIDALESTAFGAPPYNPVPAEQMFIAQAEWQRIYASKPVLLLSPFDDGRQHGTGSSAAAASADSPADGLADGGEADERARLMALGGKPGRNFTTERAVDKLNVFEALVAHVKRLMKQKKRVIIACWSPGARERFVGLLADHGLSQVEKIENFSQAEALPPQTLGLAVLGLEQGFEAPDLAIIGEQDILGDRLVRPQRKRRKAADVLSEAASLGQGDLVVHADHGIGRFKGLKTIEALGAPHDCLELHYHGGDKLYLPVENIELLSRYGSDDAGVQLDCLGSLAWQNRKARLKKRLRDIAADLIKVAALRQLRQAPAIAPPEGAYEEFAARFQHEETEDQTACIEQVLEDLGAGKPMDRLICGDVGFGKTEVAMRACFAAAMEGLQVAVVVPTTLLARQHYRSFAERFEGLPVKVAQASRLVGSRELAAVRAGLADGSIDIVIGTHALLAKSINFARLGLLVIDEEQRFGVTHKERLKAMREDVHVLTLTATPIPRTLQLALSGVRELSLITTPPLDRLAVRTYISQFDPVILRDALRRERHRGGQTYYVAPRISDLDGIAEFLAEYVPELRVARAHGRLGAGALEDVMTAFYDGGYDVLLSTAIVESGLDVPNANTMIVHRADMFGLAQLYQLRGRVGRSKTRAYAYFTTPVNQILTETAEKRLKVLQSLDTLGAGFTLASHDLDIRGGGNLLGEEQSGHIREVGFELYQSMLEETVAAMKGGDMGEADDQWSPQISLGTAVLIPETYIVDLPLRLGLYRRLSRLEDRQQIDDFGMELIDRFGPYPDEVTHLLDVVEIKALCRRANIAKFDAGPKGAVIAFRRDQFPNPAGLIDLMQKMPSVVKLQSDHKMVYRADWIETDKRLKGVRELVRELAALAEAPANN